IPNRIDEWNFVSEKFDDVKRDRNPENPGMRQHLQLFRQVNHAEALQQPQRRNGCVEVEARREPSPKREPQRLDRIHTAILLLLARVRRSTLRPKSARYNLFPLSLVVRQSAPAACSASFIPFQLCRVD